MPTDDATQPTASGPPASTRTLSWGRVLRDGAILSGTIITIGIVVLYGPTLVWWSDARSWWTVDFDDLYGVANTDLLAVGAFRLSPAAAWLVAPLTLLPWTAFVAVFMAINIGAVAIIGRRRTLLLLFAVPLVAVELINGNIHLLMAAAIYLGMRWPVFWAFILLTKVTPGVGLVWFAARREWWALAQALGATAVIVAMGLVLAPDLWLGWFESLGIAAGQTVPTIFPPPWIRLPIAAGIAWYAGRKGLAWLVPVASVVGMPTIWPHSGALLVACFPLWWERDRWRPVSAAGATVDPYPTPASTAP